MLSNQASIVLAPFVATVVINIILFYTRENATGLTTPHFLLACLSAIMLLSYQVLQVFSALPSYAPIAYGVVGACLLIGSLVMIWRW